MVVTHLAEKNVIIVNERRTEMTSKQLQEFQDSGKKIGAIEELEKIKTEILSECPNTNARMICMSIIDKHIAELKGESNE